MALMGRRRLGGGYGGSMTGQPGSEEPSPQGPPGLARRQMGGQPQQAPPPATQPASAMAGLGDPMAPVNPQNADAYAGVDGEMGGGVDMQALLEMLKRPMNAARQPLV